MIYKFIISEHEFVVNLCGAFLCPLLAAVLVALAGLKEEMLVSGKGFGEMGGYGTDEGLVI